MRAIAIRISLQKATRFKSICVPTPVTGVKNGGAIIVHDNGLPS